MRTRGVFSGLLFVFMHVGSWWGCRFVCCLYFMCLGEDVNKKRERTDPIQVPGSTIELSPLLTAPLTHRWHMHVGCENSIKRKAFLLKSIALGWAVHTDLNVLL